MIGLRQNPTSVSQVQEFLTNAFRTPSQTSEILKKLQGQQLTCILQSLGLPGLNGKGKQRQMELLVKHNVDGKQWNIIFPDKAVLLVKEKVWEVTLMSLAKYVLDLTLLDSSISVSHQTIAQAVFTHQSVTNTL